MPGVIQSIMFTGYTPPVPLTPPTHLISGNIQAPTTGTYNMTSASLVGTYADNDVFFALINTANETPPSTPAGWTYLTSYGTGTVGDAASVALHAAWRRASGTVGNAAFGDPVVALSGTADSSGEPVPFPAASTTTDQNLVVHAIAHSQSSGVAWTENWLSPNLTGGAELFSNGTTLEHGGGIAAYAGVKAVAGSLGSVSTEIKGITATQLYARATYAFIP